MLVKQCTSVTMATKNVVGRTISRLERPIAFGQIKFQRSAARKHLEQFILGVERMRSLDTCARQGRPDVSRLAARDDKGAAGDRLVGSKAERLVAQRPVYHDIEIRSDHPPHHGLAIFRIDHDLDEANVAARSTRYAAEVEEGITPIVEMACRELLENVPAFFV